MMRLYIGLDCDLCTEEHYAIVCESCHAVLDLVPGGAQSGKCGNCMHAFMVTREDVDVYEKLRGAGEWHQLGLEGDGSYYYAIDEKYG